MSALFRGQHEHGLREVHLPRQLLHRLVVHLAAVREHRELISREGGVGEDVGDDVAEPHTRE